MDDNRRITQRQKSFLQGRIYFNNRRSSIDCLIRDYSETGARLKFSETITVPEAIELFVPNREETYRARVQWRSGNEMGIAFDLDVPTATPAAPQGDIQSRVHKLEEEVAALRRLVNEMRIGIRKHHGEEA